MVQQELALVPVPLLVLGQEPVPSLVLGQGPVQELERVL
jgi:hypothetical protein